MQSGRCEGFEYENGFEKERLVRFIGPHAEAAVALFAAEQKINCSCGHRVIAAQEAHVLTAKRMRPLEGAHEAVTGNLRKRIGGYAVSAQEISKNDIDIRNFFMNFS